MLKKMRLAVSLIMLLSLVEAQACDQHGGVGKLLVQFNESGVVECLDGSVEVYGSEEFFRFVESELEQNESLEIVTSESEEQVERRTSRGIVVRNGGKGLVYSEQGSYVSSEEQVERRPSRGIVVRNGGRGLVYSEQGSDERSKEQAERRTSRGIVSGAGGHGLVYSEQGSDQRSKEQAERRTSRGIVVGTGGHGLVYSEQGSDEISEAPIASDFTSIGNGTPLNAEEIKEEALVPSDFTGNGNGSPL